MKIILRTGVLAFASMATAQMIIPEAKVENPNFVPKDGGKNLALCESDCDKDSDCRPGLVCADERKAILKKMGFDERKANCKGPNLGEWNYEVCFDPKILNGGGAGGDPHFRTYDGTKYTYHGECDLVMAHGQLDDQLMLDVHARTKIIDNWSLIANAAVRIGDDIFEVDNDGFSHFFNGVKNIEFPIMLAGKYEVTANEQVMTSKDEINGEDVTAKEMVYTIDLLNKGSMTISNFRSMLSIRVDSYLLDTYGMLGHRTKDGLIGRDGETEAVNENEMGAQWQVRDTEPMLFHEVNGPQYPESCILPAITAQSSRKLRSSEFENNAKKACENVDEDMKAYCIEDVIRTGNVSTARIYLAGAW